MDPLKILRCSSYEKWDIPASYVKIGFPKRKVMLVSGWVTEGVRTLAGGRVSGTNPSVSGCLFQGGEILGL